jgi:hypothetical protein
MFVFLFFILDVVKEHIGRGGSADVYRCMFLKENVEVALKVFHISGIVRDKTVGFDKELESEYTLSYRDRFIIKISTDVSLDCVVMDLFNFSLEKFLLLKLNSKEIMSEEVFLLYLFYPFFYRIYF